MIDPTGVRPTGVPDDALQAADAINANLGARVSVPGPQYNPGLLFASSSVEQVKAAALVSLALSFADAAKSLRKLAGREEDTD